MALQNFVALVVALSLFVASHGQTNSNDACYLQSGNNGTADTSPTDCEANGQVCCENNAGPTELQGVVCRGAEPCQNDGGSYPATENSGDTNYVLNNSHCPSTESGNNETCTEEQVCCARDQGPSTAISCMMQSQCMQEPNYEFPGSDELTTAAPSLDNNQCSPSFGGPAEDCTASDRVCCTTPDTQRSCATITHCDSESGTYPEFTTSLPTTVLFHSSSEATTVPSTAPVSTPPTPPDTTATTTIPGPPLPTTTTIAGPPSPTTTTTSSAEYSNANCPTTVGPGGQANCENLQQVCCFSGGENNTDVECLEKQQCQALDGTFFRATSTTAGQAVVTTSFDVVLNNYNCPVSGGGTQNCVSNTPTAVCCGRTEGSSYMVSCATETICTDQGGDFNPVSSTAQVTTLSTPEPIVQANRRCYTSTDVEAQNCRAGQTQGVCCTRTEANGDLFTFCADSSSSCDTQGGSYPVGISTSGAQSTVVTTTTLAPDPTVSTASSSSTTAPPTATTSTIAVTTTVTTAVTTTGTSTVTTTGTTTTATTPVASTTAVVGTTQATSSVATNVVVSSTETTSTTTEGPSTSVPPVSGNQILTTESPAPTTYSGLSTNSMPSPAPGPAPSISTASTPTTVPTTVSTTVPTTSTGAATSGVTTTVTTPVSSLSSTTAPTTASSTATTSTGPTTTLTVATSTVAVTSSSTGTSSSISSTTTRTADGTSSTSQPATSTTNVAFSAGTGSSTTSSTTDPSQNPANSVNNPTGSDDGSTGAIVGSVVGVLCLAGGVVAVVIVMNKKKKVKKISQVAAEPDESKTQLGHQQEPSKKKQRKKHMLRSSSTGSFFEGVDEDEPASKEKFTKFSLTEVQTFDKQPSKRASQTEEPAKPVAGLTEEQVKAMIAASAGSIQALMAEQVRVEAEKVAAQQRSSRRRGPTAPKGGDPRLVGDDGSTKMALEKSERYGGSGRTRLSYRRARLERRESMQKASPPPLPTRQKSAKAGAHNTSGDSDEELDTEDL